MANKLRITYHRVENTKMTKSGYTNIEGVSARHASQSVDNNKYINFITDAVKDFRYFINVECREVINTFKEPLKILDVGCGNGIYYYFFKHLIDTNITYSGCEISDSMVDVCKKNCPRAKFFKSFADNIDAQDLEYDAIFCSGTLQYTLDRWKESLIEMKRVSKKYIWILRLPLVKYTESCCVEQNIVSDGYSEQNYFSLLNREEFEGFLRKAKLKVIKRDYSSEEYIIEGVTEKVVLVQYLLSKF